MVAGALWVLKHEHACDSVVTCLGRRVLRGCMAAHPVLSCDFKVYEFDINLFAIPSVNGSSVGWGIRMDGREAGWRP